MLTQQEKDFIVYWENNRERRKKVIKQLFIGLPLGTLLVSLILISSLSGWYKRAVAEININSSLIIILLIASLFIVAFIVVFSVRHRWEMDEQQYLELKAREKKNDF